jgi:hypothetical protein
MTEERYVELVDEIVEQSMVMVIWSQGIWDHLIEKREIYWFTEDRSDIWLRSLEAEMLRTLGTLAQGR